MLIKKKTTLALMLSLCSIVGSVNAQESSTPATPAPNQATAREIANKLANPVASMISVPFQFNLNVGVGPYNGSQLITNFQPVIPIKLSSNWNLVTRTIVPFMENRDIISPNSTQFGISDINFTAFVAPSHGRLIWGIGPSLSMPSASSKFMGSQKWCAGPSAVVLKQLNGWTVGALVRQTWSFAGSSNRENVSLFYMQPFTGYSFKSGASIGTNIEIQENWIHSSDFQATLNVTASVLSKFGTQPVQFAVGPRIPLNTHTPGDWGMRASMVLIFK